MDERLLLGPGPSNCPARVLEALARPTIGHLDPQFLALMDRVQADLRAVFRTENRFTIAVSGTGSAGMQALVANLVGPGERMVACVNGVFGGRAAEAARRVGADVVEVAAPWGRPVDLDAVAGALAAGPVKALFFVHAETSTGVRSDAAALAGLAREHGALSLMDCVTSLGGTPVEIDAWGVDAAFSGTQKCLSVPPGLAPLTLGESALAAIEARAAPPPTWYLDMGLVRAYWGEERVYHHTAPVNMLYALAEGLALALEEGLDARFARHDEAHRALLAGLAPLGLELLPEVGSRLPMLNAIRVPDGVDEAAVRRALLERHGIEVGGGLGALRGRVWRVGLMGENARIECVARFLGAFEQELAAARS